MKTLTCKQMGGPCDAAMTASTPDEMMNKGMQHVNEAHPEMAADIKKMMETKDAKLEDWKKNFDAAYEAAPEM